MVRYVKTAGTIVMEMTFLSTRELEHKYQEFPLLSGFTVFTGIGKGHLSTNRVYIGGRVKGKGGGGQEELQTPGPSEHLVGLSSPMFWGYNVARIVHESKIGVVVFSKMNRYNLL